jgi:prepilin-type N-terminal cleavage/methylation domain-containing protein
MPADLPSFKYAAKRERDDAGFTLVELLMAVLILTIVLAIASGLLVSLSATVSREDLRSQANDQVRLAVQQIDRQIRSGDIFYDPSTETDPAHGISPGLSLRVLTQANATNHCVQWRISSGNLQTRSWAEDWSLPGAWPWQTVATGITNTTSQPAFVLDPAAGFGHRTLDIDILVNMKGTSSTGSEITDSVTGRNTEYGYSPNACAIATSPPYS